MCAIFFRSRRNADGARVFALFCLFDDCSGQGKRAARARLQNASQPRIKHTERLVQKIFCRRPGKPACKHPIRLESSESARK
jgi:hypothetical protein